MLSRISYCCCVLLMLYASFIYYPRWQKSGAEAAIAWDAAGYYWYLPSVFIYHDLKHQSFKDSILNKYGPTPDFQEAFQDPSGNWVMKYSSGMAVMYLPFFTAAHLLAKPLGFPADGFSRPYQLGIEIGGVLMGLLGLWLLRRFLKYYYEDRVVAVALVLLVFGSNYLNWGAIDCSMTHGWLFTLYVILLLQTRRFYSRPGYGTALSIGLLVGLMTLTRPTDVISCLIPLLWGLERIAWPAIREKLRFFAKEYRKLLLAVLAAGAVIFIQPLYWKYATGHWIVYSYGDQGFSFLHPHLKEYTFDFTGGWLIYAPMMIFAILGIIPFVKRGANKVMVLAFSVLNYYIVASWDAWSYGSRAMVQSYPLLCILLAAFVAAAFRRRWVLALSAPFLLLFIYHNFWFTYFAHGGELWPGARIQQDPLYDCGQMTSQYFWRVAGRWKMPSPDVWKLKDTRNIFEGIPKDVKVIYRNDYERDTGVLTEKPIHGARSLQVDKDHRYSPACMFPFNDPAAEWLQARATFHCTSKEWNMWGMAEWHLALRYKGQDVHGESIRVHRALEDGQTRELTLELKINHQPADTVAVWLDDGTGGKTVLMDDLTVISFRE